MTVAELSASVPSGEYKHVRGHSKNEDIQFDFSNPLYAEPEREVVSAIYESVSNVRFPGFCNISQIMSVGVNFTSACVLNLSLQFTRFLVTIVAAQWLPCGIKQRMCTQVQPTLILLVS